MPTPLSETDLFVLFYEYEDVFLFEKDTNTELWRTYVYGEPQCGLIGLSNEWAIVGGEKLILWKNGELKTIEDEDLQWVFDVRQTGEAEVQILTDPWKDDSAIWLFDIFNERKNRITDFPDYKSKEYTDNVKW